MFAPVVEEPVERWPKNLQPTSTSGGVDSKRGRSSGDKVEHLVAVSIATDGGGVVVPTEEE